MRLPHDDTNFGIGTLEELFVFKEPDVVRRHNPLVRIPVLVLELGRVISEQQHNIA
jgi:glutathione S-transferase